MIPGVHHDELRSLLRSIAAFVGLLAVTWLLLAGIWKALPHTRAGHDQIYGLKQQIVSGGEVFSADSAPVRVAIFGNSHVQAGFKPDLFDALSEGRVASYNLGLPNANQFVAELRTLGERDQAPTHALLTQSWSGRAEPGQWVRFSDDRWLIEQIFPFRSLPRDLVQFAIRSVSYGGPFAYYERMRGFVEQARRDRGYFFIENQSHYPNHQLPENYRDPTDDQNRTLPRKLDHRGPVFDQLIEVAGEYEIQLIYVPDYLREKLAGPAPSNEGAVRALAPHGIVLLGPDYWRYPNVLFSDPTHLNREGADVYTNDLWELVSPTLLSAPTSAPPTALPSAPIPSPAQALAPTSSRPTALHRPD